MTESTSSLPGAEAPGEDPSPAQVAAFLRRHPRFLLDHPDLLAHLTPPDRLMGETVLDFQNFQVRHLQAEMADLRGRERVLLANARANLTVQNRVHLALLTLLETDGFEPLVQAIGTDLALQLDLDAAVLAIEVGGVGQPHNHASGVRVAASGAVTAWLDNRAIRLIEDAPADPDLWGPAAGLVRSQALVRLEVSSATPPALLALGSRDPGMFSETQATELLAFLGGAVERMVRTRLGLPE